MNHSGGAVEVTKDRNGMDIVVLRNHGGALARISLHGGQVLSWKTKRGEELLFISSKAIFNPPKPIRGGIAICFPQFGFRGPLEQHGFARNKMWVIDQNPPPLPCDSSEKAFVDLLLKPSEDDLKIWPHRYHEVRVEGLETLDYLDNLCEKARFTEQGDALTFESEVNRVYLDSLNEVAVLDYERKQTIVIRKEGLPDVVVWNPWEKKSKAIVDLGDEDYKQMLCVDGAAIEKPITLKPAFPLVVFDNELSNRPTVGACNQGVLWPPQRLLLPRALPLCSSPSPVRTTTQFSSRHRALDGGSSLLYPTWTTDLSVDGDQPSSPAPAGELATEGGGCEPSSTATLSTAPCN
ncbi:Glycoside hydrolase-type carbohydrate-binding [Sesbania bispinosa]|nr:Glycoside hydrolase-type carbohydrate-binding [Sesbania bispinosa]